LYETNNSFATDFIIRISKYDRNSALIFARITVNRERAEISLKESVNPKDWDSARESVRGKSIEVKAINNHIDDVRFRIKEKYRLVQEEEFELTAQRLKEAFLENQALQVCKHTICKLIQFHFKIEGEKLRAGTIKNYYATEDYLKKFIKQKFGVDDITLSKINYQFITELEFYIRKNPLKKHDPCKGNGVMKHLERFKKMIRWAKHLQWIAVDPLSGYHLVRKSDQWSGED
jgi:hypothetical protein